ncbi:MAG: c-type cytochrome [Candidatus Wallbacteria bacterium]|nr:c-type cytochrome [Candidatus Wallbacteria bacterium]
METATLTRLKIVLLVSSLLCLGLLALAAFEENLKGEWRVYQASYQRALLARAATDAARATAQSMRPQIGQVFLPDLKRIDRCTSCHAGIEDPSMKGEKQPLAAHPGTLFAHHPPDKFGCTVCHDGQGRAIHAAAAHGEVEFWPYPMLRGKAVYRSCGRCHYANDPFGSEDDLYTRGATPKPIAGSELASAVPGAEAVARGKSIFIEKGCLGCHKYRGRGGTLGPDITYAGDKEAHGYDFTHVEGEHTPANWLMQHFLAPGQVSPGSLMPDFQLSRTQAEDLTEFMLSLRRKSMPATFTPVPPRETSSPATGKQLFGLFCASCHGPNGQGSTVREVVAARRASGIDTPRQLMVPSLNHPDTLAVASDDYFRQIVTRGRPGTAMPSWGVAQGGGLRAEEIARIVGYIRSWEPPAPDLADIRADRGDARTGKVLYEYRCASCHRAGGEGGIGPSLHSNTFLAIASDEFLARTVVEGRPNTAMPSFRMLSSQQISDVLAFLRTWQPLRSNRGTALDLARAPDSSEASAAIGEKLYRNDCVMCHGPAGEGDLGPSLNTPEFLSLVSDDYLYETLTSGRPGTGMPAWRHLTSADAASLVKFVRTWQKTPARAQPAELPFRGDWDAGRLLYQGTCAGCHGTEAEGGVGPQLNNPVFLRTATDPMLYEWIAHGKTGTPMRPFLKGEQGEVELSQAQVLNLVAFLRSLQRQPRVSIARSPHGRPELGKVWFASACSSCHGTAGEGASGPSLSNPDFLRAASDGYLMGTMALGRDGTPMRSVKKGPQSILSLSSDQVNDVIAFIRSWENTPATKGIPHRYVVPWDYPLGKRLYKANCSGCHGEDGKPSGDPASFAMWAPSLNNESFLAAATDGFLQATIARGRTGTAMRPFGVGAQGVDELTSDEIDEIVAYIRQWSHDPARPRTIPAERKEAGHVE